jgi:hypothetical protein
MLAVPGSIRRRQESLDGHHARLQMR